jgi:hypothetical protein
MEIQTKSVKIIECIVTVLTLTIICGLVGKGVHFLYYTNEVCQAFDNKKIVIKTYNKD